MKILYGVQGTGNGHVSRCRTLARALARKDVEVDFVLSGREADQYFDMQDFGDFQALPGLSFATRDGRIDLWDTVRQSRPLQLWRDIRSLSLDGYDRVISDFEPVTAWAAKRQGIPTLGISHQASFAYPIPRREERPTDRLLMRHFAPVSQGIGLHWFHFGYPILPPVIDQLTARPNTGEILVYLPFETPEAIQELLSRFKSVSFVCFHPAFSEPRQLGNLSFRPLGRDSFVETLTGCNGVISNAGFELASEALTLGKKLLLKPLAGQFEQASNGLTLEIMGLAQVMDGLDPGKVRLWLDTEAPGPVCYPDVAGALADWLAAGGEEPVKQLVNRMWQQVRFPGAVCERLAEWGWSDSLFGCLLLRA